MRGGDERPRRKTAAPSTVHQTSDGLYYTDIVRRIKVEMNGALQRKPPVKTTDSDVKMTQHYMHYVQRINRSKVCIV